MEIKLIYTEDVCENPCGIFVEDLNMMSWIEAAAQLGKKQIKFFPIPGNEANTVSGAILISSDVIENLLIPYPEVYNAGGSFYMLSHSQVSPKLSEKAIIDRFGNTPHFFHKIYGLIELQELKDWSSYLELKSIQIPIVRPELGPSFPNRLGEYFIREVAPEVVLKSLIEKSVPDRKSMDSKPLNSWEKIKLAAYRLVLKTNKDKIEKKSEDIKGTDSTNNEDGNESIIKKKSWWQRKKEGLNTDLENLEERNKKELDKLMNMLKNDPDEALKYALPIDRSEFSRGPEVGFRMQRRFGLGISNGSGRSGSVDIGESRTDMLRRQYREMADNYTTNKEWEKASFVYLELLSEPSSAADTLKLGKKYEAAAAIYLTKCKLKNKAAECYEMGRFYGRAIDLYEELDRQEKVGDIYTKMGDQPKAKSAYSKEISKLIDSKRFYHAAEISKNKLSDLDLARTHFMGGWKSGNRPNDCLNEYLETYDLDGKRESISELHQEQFEGDSAHQFLEVLKLQFDKNTDLKDEIEVIVYETIARNSFKDVAIVNLLESFNKSELISKDVMRFKHGRR